MRDIPSEKILHIAQNSPDLHLLLLFGSRARGVAQEESDWDFSYLADKQFDPLPLIVDLQLLLKTDKVDLVDLTRASGLLRFRAAKDGILLYENPKGQYQKFWLEAVNFWCDTSRLFQLEYEGILEELG